MLYLCGPGHGGPAVVANVYLEGTYSEFYPNVGQDVHGLEALFRQFSFPGGISSHCGSETPGSIHEGGELGYSLSHAYGAAFDNPNLIVACIIGDGEAEVRFDSSLCVPPLSLSPSLPCHLLTNYLFPHPVPPTPPHSDRTAGRRLAQQ